METLLGQIIGIPLAFAQKAAVDDVASGTQDQITGLVTFLVGQIPLWITAIIVLIATFIVARLAKSAVENKMTAEGFEEEHKEIQIVAGRTTNAVVLLVGITVALKIAGLDLTPVIAAGAFGIGFALQDLIMNFLAGVMILTARHYTIGDIIKVNGTLGKIVEIQTRATILKAFDGTKIVVPNAELFKNQVTSYTSNPFRRIQLINGVAYGSDLKKTMEVVINAVKNTQGVLVEPKPSVWFYEWGDSSINFKINAWVDTRGGWISVRTRMMINITSALDAAGIEIPYPIQTIYMGKEEGQESGLEKEVKTTMAGKAQATIQSGAPKPFISSSASTAESQVDQTMPQAALTPPPINTEAFDAPDWLKKAIPKPTPQLEVPMGELVLHSQVEQQAQPAPEQAYAPAPVYTAEPAYAQQPVETQIAAPIQNVMPTEQAPNPNFSASQQ